MNLNLDAATIIQTIGGAAFSALVWYFKRAMDEQKAREEADRVKREQHDQRREAQYESTTKLIGEVVTELRDHRKDTAHQFETVRLEMRTTREVLSGRADAAVEGITANRQSIASLGARVGAIETEQAVHQAVARGKREAI